MKHYDTDGVYLGCLWFEDGWWRAEDRVLRRYRGKVEAMALTWLRMRRVLVLGPMAPAEKAA